MQARTTGSRWTVARACAGAALLAITTTTLGLLGSLLLMASALPRGCEMDALGLACFALCVGGPLGGAIGATWGFTRWLTPLCGCRPWSGRRALALCAGEVFLWLALHWGVICWFGLPSSAQDGICAALTYLTLMCGPTALLLWLARRAAPPPRQEDPRRAAGSA